MKTRGTTQIAASAAASRSNKRYPLTRAHGSAWQQRQHLGSEVMDLVAGNCRFAPNTDSLKAPYRTVFVTAFFCIAVIIQCPSQKVKCFHGRELYNFRYAFGGVFVQNRKKRFFGSFLLTNLRFRVYNGYNQIQKDNDGKFAFRSSSREPAVGVSRCGIFWRSDS